MKEPEMLPDIMAHKLGVFTNTEEKIICNDCVFFLLYLKF